MRVIICGTIPSQCNGYSKVVYNLAKGLSEMENMDVSVFGFQKQPVTEEHLRERELPSNVEVIDALAMDNKDNNGFGVNVIADYVKMKNPDIVVIYNDIVIVSLFIKILKNIGSNVKVVPYLDLVYNNHQLSTLDYIASSVDDIIFFTEYWKDSFLKSVDEKYVRKLGSHSHVLEHGVCSRTNYPISKRIARGIYGIKEDDFVILNLNRNQPRKRWDVMISCFINFLSMKRGDIHKIKLVIGTNMKGYWDLDDIIRGKCKDNNMSYEEIKSCFIEIKNPQKLSDRHINILYNVADIGINTCDGEGYGLCNYEQAFIGIPQIIPNIGGFRSNIHIGESIKINPVMKLYNSNNGKAGGEIELCLVDDYTRALNIYYSQRNYIEDNGANARARIKSDKSNSWSNVSKRFYEILQRIGDDNVDIEKLMKKKNVVVLDEDEKISTQTQTQTQTQKVLMLEKSKKNVTVI
jgi:glycosyltransferase involved in cell wall biosynthesis